VSLFRQAYLAQSVVDAQRAEPAAYSRYARRRALPGCKWPTSLMRSALRLTRRITT